MRSVLVLAAIVIVVLAAGGLTAHLANFDVAIIQTSSPDASVFEATPVQSAAFFAMVLFILVNVLGAGLTIMAIFWLLNRQLLRAQAEDAEASA